MRGRRWTGFLLALALALGAAGCGPHGEHGEVAGPAAKRQSRLVIALGHGLDYIGVDPFVPGRENSVLATAIYEPLALENPEGEIEPVLAEAWETSPDGLTWTFFLRRGVKFHDGTELTAEAVEAAYRRYLRDPATALRLGVKDIAVIDPYTVAFTLEKPSSTFLRVAASFSTVIPAPAAHDEEGRLVSPIGTGPFRVVRAGRQEVELAAFEDHWRSRPALDQVLVRYLPDPTTMVLSLEAGEVDLIGADGSGIPRSEIRRLMEDPHFETTVDLRDSSIEWVGFNLARPALADVRVRQAINLAVDRAAMVEHLLEGFGTPAVGPLHFDPEAPWVNPAIEGYPFDPERAKALLAEAGWHDSDGDGVLDKDGQELRLTLLFEGTRDWKQYAEAMQRDLARVGIQLDLQMRDGGVIQAMQQQGEYDLVALSGIGKSLAEPNYYFFYYYSSYGGGSVLKDRQLDGLIFRLSETTDREAREQLYHSIQARIWEAVPGAYLVHPARVSVARAGLAGWRSAGTMDPLRWLYQARWE